MLDRVKTDGGFRMAVVLLLSALLVVEAARGIAETRRVVEIAGTVDVDDVRGQVDANVTNALLTVEIDR